MKTALPKFLVSLLEAWRRGRYEHHCAGTLNLNLRIPVLTWLTAAARREEIGTYLVETDDLW